MTQIRDIAFTQLEPLNHSNLWLHLKEKKCLVLEMWINGQWVEINSMLGQNGGSIPDDPDQEVTANPIIYIVPTAENCQHNLDTLEMLRTTYGVRGAATISIEGNLSGLYSNYQDIEGIEDLPALIHQYSLQDILDWCEEEINVNNRDYGGRCDVLLIWTESSARLKATVDRIIGQVDIDINTGKINISTVRVKQLALEEDIPQPTPDTDSVLIEEIRNYLSSNDTGINLTDDEQVVHTISFSGMQYDTSNLFQYNRHPIASYGLDFSLQNYFWGNNNTQNNLKNQLMLNKALINELADNMYACIEIYNHLIFDGKLLEKRLLRHIDMSSTSYSNPYTMYYNYIFMENKSNGDIEIFLYLQLPNNGYVTTIGGVVVKSIFVRLFHFTKSSLIPFLCSFIHNYWQSLDYAYPHLFFPNSTDNFELE